MTREFFARLPDFEAATSDLARTEADATRDPARRLELLALLDGLELLPITREAVALGNR